jgi:hypothetical protein
MHFLVVKIMKKPVKNGATIQGVVKPMTRHVYAAGKEEVAGGGSTLRYIRSKKALAGGMHVL